jgi:hypothetical protein
MLFLNCYHKEDTGDVETNIGLYLRRSKSDIINRVTYETDSGELICQKNRKHRSRWDSENMNNLFDIVSLVLE